MKIIATDGDITKTIIAKEGELLLSLLREAETSIQAPCGGAGKCGKCTAIIEGIGEVLTCKTKVSQNMVNPETGNIHLSIPVYGGAVIKSLGKMPQFSLDPLIWDMNVKLPVPSIKDQIPDDTRIKKETGRNLAFHLLKKLPTVLRDSNFSVNVKVRQDIDEITSICTAKENIEVLGVAVDIGTTTLSASLFNLKTGEYIASANSLNPQKAYGADVISRIDYASISEENLKKLQKIILEEIIRLTNSIVKDLNFVQAFCIAGNTTMMHLLCGFNPAAIAKAPFTPVTLNSQIKYFHELFPEKMDSIKSDSIWMLLPSLSGYVGADITAGIIATSLDLEDKNSMLVDIGTNGEIALRHGEKIVCCSVAAGPAFEGANITCGTGGIAGSIDKTEYKNKDFEYTTIGDKEPIGICGSGILSIVASLLQARVIDETGRFCDEDEAEDLNLSKHFEQVKDQRVFVLVKDANGVPKVYITQKDIREVQNAKAAINAGIKLLIAKSGLTEKDIDQLYIAGGFGNFMDVNDAFLIGLLPPELKGKVVSSGNTSAAGAALCMLDYSVVERIKRIEEITEYYELSSDSDFTDLYIDSMIFEEFE